MNVITSQTDRPAGVLLTQAVGDALGVPYEFATPPEDEPQMLGGGLGPFAPGEWSDDTQMAACIAQVAATGVALDSAEGLEQVAVSFLDWIRSGPADVGIQTRRVLSAVNSGDGPAAARMAAAAADLHQRTGRTAGNGALMRTGIVGLTRLEDLEATARAARAVAELTHADPLAGDSCVLWSEAVRVAVTEARLDLTAGLDLLPGDRRQSWASWIEDAEAREPCNFTGNGYTVVALQAAWSAITHTSAISGPDHMAAALQTAIQIGHDTDTVAAIAGALLGARYGASAVPVRWSRLVHGWPGLRSRDLVHLAVRTANGGADDPQGWPSAYRMDLGDQRPLAAPLPSDPEVLLGTFADLARTEELGVDAVVSLCRLGTREFTPGGISPTDHVEVWVVDSDDPAKNQHLAWVLDEAARAVTQLRSEGRRVLLHCVAAHHRTPSVALRYLLARGLSPESAVAEVESALGRRVNGGLLWKEAQNVR